MRLVMSFLSAEPPPSATISKYSAEMHRYRTFFKTRSGLCADGATAGIRAESFFISETSEAPDFPRSDSFGNKAANGANTEAARKTNGSASAQSARRAAKRKSGRNFNMANVKAGRLLRIRRERL